MEINSPLCGKIIDLVMGISCNRNASFALDADLALLIVNADVSVRTQNCSDPYLKRDAGFLRPRLKWSAELLRLALELRRGIVQNCVEIGRRVSHTRI